MALLNRGVDAPQSWPRTPGSQSRVRRGRLVFAALLVAAGCVVFGGGSGPAEERFAFSHKVHVEDEGLDCTDCHMGAADTDEPGMPALGGCKLCHAERDADKPPERRVEALYEGEVYRRTPASELGNEIVFSHAAHVKAVEECATCHTGIGTNEVIDASIAVEKPDCLTCHAERGVSDRCETCHRQQRRDRAPHTHDGLWLRFHGKVVRAESSALVDRCEMCHEKNACQACHQDQMPASHNNFFRRRGHGLMARMDRESCSACHRPDSCESCHSQVLPQNHTGAFGGRQSTHCFSCHFPLQSSDCATCHRTDHSHAMAAPLPPDHSPAMNCRQCHGLSAPLPHVDKGDQCTACHR